LRAYLGATPERLLKRRGRFILSEALAGTRPRGRTIAEDAQFARELLQNEKENREHRIVVNDICSTFNRYCDRVSSGDAPGIRKLAHCQHLHTPISGWLQGDGNDAHLMQSLHPTSAVGGLPKEAAVQWILKNEPFERGIYAAPVGWVGAHASEFCVGIRSGLILDKTLTLYSGAGIVAGADADNEWMELDAKLNGFLMGMRDNCTNECI
jgi:menaquinone-specific isochorismate synthase